jgi:hypothetical protein
VELSSLRPVKPDFIVHDAIIELCPQSTSQRKDLSILDDES